MTQTTTLSKREPVSVTAVVDRMTRSPWWLPLVTLSVSSVFVALESIRVRLVQIRADLQDIDVAVAKTGELASAMGDATGLALGRLEYLLPSLSTLTVAFLAATLILSVLTAMAPALPRVVRGATIAIVVGSVLFLFRNIN
jgi:hypothetical protein